MGWSKNRSNRNASIGVRHAPFCRIAFLLRYEQKRPYHGTRAFRP